MELYIAIRIESGCGGNYCDPPTISEVLVFKNPEEVKGYGHVIKVKIEDISFNGAVEIIES